MMPAYVYPYRSPGTRLWTLIPRRARIHLATRRYKRHLQALRTDDIPFSRANRLDLMALLAEGISAAERRDRETEAWGATVGILRAIAASERFEVLSDPDFCGQGGITTAPYRAQWEALAAARNDDDRVAGARILMGLCTAAAGQPGVLVLDDIADAELALAGEPAGLQAVAS
ncbi:MAG TPA: hypothetical protein VMG38_06310 [Trebonia sp.]|nr:hypothetical protein [Trebonia sp.]